MLQVREIARVIYLPLSVLTQLLLTNSLDLVFNVILR